MTLHDPGGNDPGAAGARKRGVRRMALVAVLLALAALAVWSASRMPWVGYTSEDGLQPPQDVSIDGSEWASELTPLAVVLLAGIAAMFAVRGWGQRVVGLLVGAAGAGVLARSVTVLTSAVDPAKITGIEELRASVTITATAPHSGGAVLAGAGGLAAVSAGLILMARPRPRRKLPSKYVTPAARRDSVEQALAERAQACRTSAGNGAGAHGGKTDGAGASARADGSGAVPGSVAWDGSDMTQRLFWEALDAGADPTDLESD